MVGGHVVGGPSFRGTMWSGVQVVVGHMEQRRGHVGITWGPRGRGPRGRGPCGTTCGSRGGHVGATLPPVVCYADDTLVLATGDDWGNMICATERVVGSDLGLKVFLRKS